MNNRDRLRTGLAAACSDPGVFDGDPIGLITNYTGLTDDLVPNVKALTGAGVTVSALLGPEHGISGAAQDGQGEVAENLTGQQVHDTYGLRGDALADTLDRCPTRHFVFDIQDIGSRFYTYIWTLFDCLEAADRLGAAFTVLDRPNPLGGAVAEGIPGNQPWISSFVGRIPIPVRHGLTVGELARYFCLAGDFDSVDLRVVELTGWDRHGYADEWPGHSWVMPSPNLPTLDTAIAYPGTCLFEGTTLSEGRGTTRPFEIIGAPFVDQEFHSACEGLALAGVRFREVTFVPAFGKFSGIVCRGVALHVTDRTVFRPVHTALSMMDAAFELYPGDANWFAGEEDSYRIDRLWGTAELRETRAGGQSLAALAGAVITPGQWAGPDIMLYE